MTASARAVQGVLYSRAISGSANPLQVYLVVAFVIFSTINRECVLTMFVIVSFEPGVTYCDFSSAGVPLSHREFGARERRPLRAYSSLIMSICIGISSDKGKALGTRQIQRESLRNEREKEREKEG